ncbi:class I SAM-dependent methyltransferase [Microbacterium sp. ABRD28]|uniref:class I SAM-dependent methyltransferase n=1 Tax=Microbacterium sp. ABRD28 TaxID=2268461 RepID=UPI001F0CD272|nr:class I SAM-dependent methyltransferase [Microbacterium sp. ABRD28]
MSDVVSAYSRRAAEYSELLGSMTAMHHADVHLITSWASQCDGTVLDAGCGPGHWTGHLAAAGVDARGIDQVPSFIDHARTVHPGTPFEVGDIDAMPYPNAEFGGVLAWYSLIHHDPDDISRPLAEFARVLRRGGSLLVGCFLGGTIEGFDHAVVRAFRWPSEALHGRLIDAGFEILETHTRTGSPASSPKPHAAIIARRH